MKMADGRCSYCGIQLTIGTMTGDHVIPRSIGGGKGFNLIPACKVCNTARGDKPIYLYRYPKFLKARYFAVLPQAIQINLLINKDYLLAKYSSGAVSAESLKG